MDQREIGIIMRPCVILHNMNVKDERDYYKFAFDYDVVEGTIPEPIINHDHHLCYETYFQISKQVRGPDTYAALQVDLIAETWKCNSGQR